MKSMAVTGAWLVPVLITSCGGAQSPGPQVSGATDGRAAPNNEPDPVCAELTGATDALAFMRQVQGDAVVLHYGIGFPDLDAIRATLVDAGALAAEPLAVFEATIRAGEREEDVVVQGLSEEALGRYANRVIDGSLAALGTQEPITIALTQGMAGRLRVRVGEVIEVRHPSRTGEEGPVAAVVGAVVELPAGETVDLTPTALVSLTGARELAGELGEVSAVMVFGADHLDEARQAIPQSYRLLAFEELNAALLAAIEDLRQRCSSDPL